jgi:hypothetical protein
VSLTGILFKNSAYDLQVSYREQKLKGEKKFSDKTR